MALFRSTDDFTSACDSDADDKDDEMLKVAGARLDAASVVNCTLLRHRLLPVSVTNETSLEDKARGLVHPLWIDLGARKDRLLASSSMIRGTCTDRGTEFGLVGAEGGNAVSYAAPWIQGSRALYVDGCVPVQQKQKLSMPNAVVCAGI